MEHRNFFGVVKLKDNIITVDTAISYETIEVKETKLIKKMYESECYVLDKMARSRCKYMNYCLNHS
ncbi:hypothetical protein LQF67_07915 [Tetragenococcus halophilus]|uniref:hypothetical protein n=1 Tax=Tetragenococcus halophilus TaxID=51669 RepID=UPI001F196A5E|nr:hypothetical protein [Tetragenococcus halophilus]MCF1685514.1 hypothetical protein [Tetragenococcus halophilus]